MYKYVNKDVYKMYREGKKIYDISCETLKKSFSETGIIGVLFDPSDLSTLYQDVTGTVPVTGEGQPVGLMLDKSKSLALSPEKWITTSVVVNGESQDLGGGSYRILSTAGAASGAIINNSAVIGKLYKVEYTINSIAVVGDGITFESAVGTTIIHKTTGRKTVYIQAFNTSLYIKRSGICDYNVSNITVKEVYGNHASQITSSKRPILQRNSTTGSYYLAFDGVDDFLTTSTLDFGQSDSVTLLVSTRLISNSTVGMICEYGANAANGVFSLSGPYAALENTLAFASKGSSYAYAIANPITYPSNNVVSAKGDIYDGGLSLSYIKVNQSVTKTVLTDQGVGTLGSKQLYIGMRSGTSLPFNGYLYFLGVVSKIISDTDIATVEKSIARDIGVVL